MVPPVLAFASGQCPPSQFTFRCGHKTEVMASEEESLRQYPGNCGVLCTKPSFHSMFDPCLPYDLSLSHSDNCYSLWVWDDSGTPKTCCPEARVIAQWVKHSSLT